MVFLFSSRNLMKMSLFQSIFLILLPLIGVNLYASFAEIEWLQNLPKLLFVLGVLFIYLKRNSKYRLNAFIYLFFLALALIVECWNTKGALETLSFLFYILAFFGLSREAVWHTHRKNGSKMITFYVVLLIAANTYLLLTHVLSLQNYMSSNLEFGIYIIYYINLLILGIIALVYYLNSYSKKSVYFITMVLAFIFSNVFRDTAIFYIKDPILLIMGNFLWFTAISFSLCFFLTPERKLRLTNLV